MACCKLAAKGRSLADSSYDTEVRTILDFLQMQKPIEGRPALNPSNLDINPEHFVSPRYFKKLRGRVSKLLKFFFYSSKHKLNEIFFFRLFNGLSKRTPTLKICLYLKQN